jgi:hypothetical protein
MTANRTSTVESLNTLAAEMAAHPEAAAQKIAAAEAAYTAFFDATAADLREAYPHKAEALAAAKLVGCSVSTADKYATIIGELSDHCVVLSNVPAAFAPFEQAKSDMYAQSRVEEQATQALTDWAEGKDAGTKSYASEAQVAGYMAYLVSVANRWNNVSDNDYDLSGKDRLKSLCRTIMIHGVVAHENGLSSTYQLRVGDLDAHLGKRAAAQYALRVLAPAAFGIQAAADFGIQREWYGH